MDTIDAATADTAPTVDISPAAPDIAPSVLDDWQPPWAPNEIPTEVFASPPLVPRQASGVCHQEVQPSERELEDATVAAILARESTKADAVQQLQPPADFDDGTIATYERAEKELAEFNISLSHGEQGMSRSLSWHPQHGLRVVEHGLNAIPWREAPEGILTQHRHFLLHLKNQGLTERSKARARQLQHSANALVEEAQVRANALQAEAEEEIRKLGA